MQNHTKDERPLKLTSELIGACDNSFAGQGDMYFNFFFFYRT